MINKQKFSIQNTKKVLHKHGKQWIVVSAAVLMMLWIGSVSTKISHANNTANAQVNSVKVAPNNNNHNNTANVTSINNSNDTTKQSAVADQAANLHSQILRNANNAQNLNEQQKTSRVSTSSTLQTAQVAVPSTQVGQTDDAVARLQNLQKLYTMYEALVDSGIFSDADNNQVPDNSNNQPVQPSDNANVPKAPSDHQLSDNYITGNLYGLNYKYDQANQAVEFTGGKCNYNGSDSDATPIFGQYASNGKPNLFSDVTSAKFDSDCDFSGVTNMQFMLSNSTHLQSLTLPSNFDTSNVTNMARMFASDYKLQSLTLPDSFDTSNVTNMSDMFDEDQSIRSLILPDSFDTGNVTDMDSMFSNDSDLQSLTLPDSFSTSDVSDMSAMFMYDVSLPSLTLPDSFSTNNVNTMEAMFSEDTDLRSLNLPSSFTVNSDTNTSDMFYSDNNLQVPYIPGYHASDDNTASDNAPSDNQNNDSDNPVQQTLQQMKAQVLSDINNDRAQYGQPALQMNSDMNEIANQRAQQIESNFSHYDGNGNTYYLEDANSDGIDLSDESMSGENIGMQWFSPVTFSSDLGSQIADGTDHSMMYNDASSNWGHRKNILSPDYGVIGIGTAYNGNGGFYIAEDFAANPPSDSSN